MRFKSVWIVTAVLAALSARVRAQPTAFTYQGELKRAGSLASGVHDFRFGLFDAASGGTQLGARVCSDNGRAMIELPRHFRDLASAKGMTVQVTPLSEESGGLAVVKKSLDGIVVAGNDEFDWRVEAVRKGHEDYQVMRPWSRSDADEAQAWENRMKRVQERRKHGKP